jgi:hypothetical protein
VGLVSGKGEVPPLPNCTLSSPVAVQRWQHERCGAGCWSRLAIASCWLPVRPSVLDLQLRQNYITPHFGKCSPVATLKLHLVSPTASRPHGFPKQALCKIAFAGPGLSAACTPQPLRVLRAVACRPCGVLALWQMSGALRIVVVSGFAVHRVLAPAHPWGLLASQHRPRGLPVRPPKGAPSDPRTFPGCQNCCRIQFFDS